MSKNKPYGYLQLSVEELRLIKIGISLMQNALKDNLQEARNRSKPDTAEISWYENHDGFKPIEQLVRGRLKLGDKPPKWAVSKEELGNIVTAFGKIQKILIEEYREASIEGLTEDQREKFDVRFEKLEQLEKKLDYPYLKDKSQDPDEDLGEDLDGNKIQ